MIFLWLLKSGEVMLVVSARQWRLAEPDCNVSILGTIHRNSSRPQHTHIRSSLSYLIKRYSGVMECQ